MRLAARGIEVAFGANQVLRTVSVAVEAGESVALMGPSGSGKSTLLSVLGGLLRPDRGEVTYDGPTTKAGLAWIFQNANVLPRRTAIDNVMFGAFRNGSRLDESRALGLQALDRIGMGRSADRTVGVLSGGERQRVAVAAALISNPPLLLADEPTAQLDHSNAELVTGAILGLAEETSVVIATHDEGVAQACDRTIRLRDGVIDG